MDNYGINENIQAFSTVGMLRNLLIGYSDDTPITVCGITGLFYPNNEQQYILLETADSSGYEALTDFEVPTNVWQEYMDF